MAGMNEWMKLSRELIYQQWKLLRAKLFVIGLSCSSIPKFQFSAPVADPVPSSSYSDFSLQSRHVLNAPSSITAQLSIISSSFFLLMTANLRQRISIIYVGCINNPKKSKMMCMLPTHCQAQIPQLFVNAGLILSASPTTSYTVEPTLRRAKTWRR